MAHKHGSMDTTTHEETFNGFIRLLTKGAIASAAVLIFAAIVNG